MIKDGKYRYTLQFGMYSEDEQRAGEFLERLGNRKSPIVVAAINEYLQNHPEFSNEQAKIHFHISGITPNLLEEKIREAVDAYLKSHDDVRIPSQASAVDATNQVSADILDMLGDLDCFT